MTLLTTIVGTIIKPITDTLHRRQQRKAAKEAVQGKIAVAKQENAQEVLLKDAEWETVSQQMQATSWKDEFLTIIITSPIILLLFGGVAAACGFPQVLEGTVAGLAAIQATGVDFGFLMNSVVLAGIGLKVWRY